MEWRTTTDTSQFHDTAKANQQCPGLSTAVEPTGVEFGSSDTLFAGMIKAGKYEINEVFKEEKNFEPDNDVDLTAATPVAPRVVGPEKTKIYSCPPATPTFGCTRDSYTVNNKKRVAAIVAATKTTGMTEKHETASSWGCSAGTWYIMTPTDDAKVNKAKLIETATSANETQVFMLRIVGVLLAWAGVYFMLYPLVAMADVMGDCLDMIPCIGDMLESIVEGFVECVVCAVSCSTGCACALFVIALVWIVMRPLIGSVLMAVCIGLCVCSYCVLDSQRDPEKKSRRKNKKKRKDFMEEDAEE